MNKSELIDYMASTADISKTAAERALKAFMEAVSTALKDNQQLALVGFGTFLVRERAARKARNPQNGQMIDIKASKAPVFKAGKALKESLQAEKSKE